MGARQDQRDLAQRTDIDRTVLECVARGRDEADVLGEQHVVLHRARMFGYVHHRQVDLAVAEAAKDLTRESFDETDSRVGIARLEPVAEVAEHDARDSRLGRDRQVGRAALVAATHRLTRFIERALERQCIAEQLFTTLGQTDAPAAAPEEPHTQFGFEQTDAPADRRLIRAQLHRGTRKTACFRDVREHFKVVRIHRLSMAVTDGVMKVLRVGATRSPGR